MVISWELSNTDFTPNTEVKHNKKHLIYYFALDIELKWNGIWLLTFFFFFSNFWQQNHQWEVFPGKCLPTCSVAPDIPNARYTINKWRSTAKITCKNHYQLIPKDSYKPKIDCQVQDVFCICQQLWGISIYTIDRKV